MVTETPLQAYMRDRDDTSQENLIHSDSGARAYGYSGALITGSVVYAWCVPTILEALGADWMREGWAELDFRRPVYPDDAVTVRIDPSDAEGHPFTVTGALDAVCISGAVGTGRGAWIRDHVQAQAGTPVPPPEPRPVLRLAEAPVGQDLPALLTPTSSEGARRPEELRPQHGRVPLLVDGEALVSPAYLAGRMSWYMHSLYDYEGPSIHVASRIQHLDVVRAGSPLAIAGHLREAFERKGHHYAVVDGSMYVDGRLVVLARHTVIFKVGSR